MRGRGSGCGSVSVRVCECGCAVKRDGPDRRAIPRGSKMLRLSPLRFP